MEKKIGKIGNYCQFKHQRCEFVELTLIYKEQGQYRLALTLTLFFNLKLINLYLSFLPSFYSN